MKLASTVAGTGHKAELPPASQVSTREPASQASDELIMQKMQDLEKELGAKEQTAKKATLTKGQLEVNAPLPLDFSTRFSRGVAEATGCSPNDVRVLGAAPTPEDAKIDEIVFEADKDVVAAVKNQAADPASKLANGPLHFFLVARDSTSGASGLDADMVDGPEAAEEPPRGGRAEDEEEEEEEAQGAGPPDVDSSMPYGGLEPFGREDTAKELTESSIRESDAMVDQLERAEVAEEKRAVFRALTRLRGAAISSYDGIACSQTGNLDEYARQNTWRKTHPVRHLADDESDVGKWAFPESADF